MLPYRAYLRHAACVRTCALWLWRSRSRDGPILSVSSIISIIVAFTGRMLWFSAIIVISRHGCESWKSAYFVQFQHLNCRWCMPIQESRAVAEKPRDAAVNFDTYRNWHCHKHHAVLPAIARHLVSVLQFGFFLFIGDNFLRIAEHYQTRTTASNRRMLPSGVLEWKRLNFPLLTTYFINDG